MRIRALLAAAFSLLANVALAQGWATQPTLKLDFRQGLLDNRITVTRAAATGSFWGPDGFMHVAPANTARFDWGCNYPTILTRPCGVWSELAATNLITNSEVWTAANGWTLSTAGIALGNATGLRGDANGATTVTAANANDNVCFALTNASAIRSGQFWIKRKTGTGTITASLDNFSTSTDVTGFLSTSNWYHYTQVQTVTNATLCVKVVTAGDAVIVGGAQVETGSVPTTHIFTSGGTATRNKDAITISTSGWFNCDAGTIVAGFQSSQGGANSSTSEIVAIRDTTTNRFTLAVTVAGNGAIQVAPLMSVAGVNVFNPAAANTATFRSTRIVGASYGSNWRSIFQGFTFRTGSTTPTNWHDNCVLTTLDVGAANGGSQLNGLVSFIFYFNTQLPDGMLQSLVNQYSTWDVSAVSGNGYVAGSDTNNGQTVNTPFATVDKALAVAGAGDTINVNDGTYTAASFYTLNKTLTINPVTDYGAILRSTDTTKVVLTNIGTATLNLGKIVIDGNNATSFGISTTASDTGIINLNGTEIQNATSYGLIDNLGGSTTVNWTGGLHSCTLCLSAYLGNRNVGGGLDVNGGTYSVTQANGLSGAGVFQIIGDNAVVGPPRASPAVYTVKNSTINTIANNSTVIGTGTIGGLVGLYPSNILGAVIDNNTLTCDTSAVSNGNSFGCTDIWLTPDISRLGGNVTARYSGNFQISNNTFTVNRGTTPVGNGFTVFLGQGDPATGFNGDINNLMQGGSVFGNTITDDAAGVAGGVHEIFNSGQANTLIYKNRVTGGLCLADKGGNGFFYDNILKCGGNFMVGRGSNLGVSFIHNTLLFDNTTYNGVGVLSAFNSTTGFSSVVTSIGNIFDNGNCTTCQPAQVGQPSSVGTEAGGNNVLISDYNDFTANTGSYPASAFQINTGPAGNITTTNYASLAAWKAGTGNDAHSISLTPTYVGAPNYDLTGPVGMNIVPPQSGVTTDFLGRAFANPASVGAYQCQAGC